MAISSPSTRIQDIADEFVFLDRTAVLAYLTDSGNVVPHLATLVLQARNIYGGDTVVSLRRDRDPDANSEYLVVGVRTALAPANAHTLLSRLREEWWATTPPEVEDHVLVANEFV